MTRKMITASKSRAAIEPPTMPAIKAVLSVAGEIDVMGSVVVLRKFVGVKAASVVVELVASAVVAVDTVIVVTAAVSIAVVMPTADADADVTGAVAVEQVQ
jgi:hypothetical protein